MKCCSTHELDIKVTHSKGSNGGFANSGKGLRKQVVKGLTLGEALPKSSGLIVQLFVGECLEVSLQSIYLCGSGLQLSKQSALASAKQFVNNRRQLILLGLRL